MKTVLPFSNWNNILNYQVSGLKFVHSVDDTSTYIRQRFFQIRRNMLQYK